MTSLPGDAGAGAVSAPARPASPKSHPSASLEVRAASLHAAPAALPPAPDAPSPAADAPISGDGGLASLRLRAQLARAQLGEQPLPIANQSSRLIMKLLGG